VSGFQAAFWVGAVITAIGFVSTLVLVRDSELTPTAVDVAELEGEPALDAV
jgi:hypothetical protein